MAKKTQKQEFPQTIYAKWEGDNDERYMIVEGAAQSHADINEVRVVAEYKLVRKLKVSAEIAVKVTG